MTHTPETLPELVDQLHKEIEGKNIALAKRLEWIRKVEAINADLLAALKAMLPESWEPADYLNNRKRAMDMARAAIARAEAE